MVRAEKRLVPGQAANCSVNPTVFNRASAPARSIDAFSWARASSIDIPAKLESTRSTNRRSNPMAVSEQIKALLNTILQLDGRVNAWNERTPLLGSVPELDSMAVVGIITALEEDFELAIADD